MPSSHTITPQIEQFVHDNPQGVLTSFRKNGMPQMSIVTVYPRDRYHVCIAQQHPSAYVGEHHHRALDRESDLIVRHRGHDSCGPKTEHFCGTARDTQLSAVPNPPAEQAAYRVEEEFTNAMRGREEITMVPFSSGVHYMEWTEAVVRSAQTGQAMTLPL